MAILNQGSIIKNRYVVKQLIGHGGMANVYLVNDKISNKDYALKIMKNQEDSKVSNSLKRFKAEANVLEKLNSENIVKIYDAFFDEQSKFIVMEYVDGYTLTKHMNNVGIFSNKEACKIVLQILNGLTEIHKNKMIHRDIKPGNILLSHTGQLKITDFGIVKTEDSEQLTKIGSVVGSVQYISPEILTGKEATLQLDIYATGIIFYTLLAGKNPFYGSNMKDILAKKISHDPIPITKHNEKVDEKLKLIVETTLARDPAKRYKNTEVMIQEIKRYLSNEEISETKELQKIKSKLSSTDELTKAVSLFKGKQKKELEKKNRNQNGKQKLWASLIAIAIVIIIGVSIGLIVAFT